MWPARNNTYVPFPPADPAGPSIEYVRGHGVVVLSDGDGGLVETRYNGGVYFSRVTLNPDGTVRDFAPGPVDRYARVTRAERP